MGRGPWGQAAGGYPRTSGTGAVPSPKACSSPDSQTLRGWDWALQEAVSTEEKCHGHFYFRNRARHSVLVHWGPQPPLAEGVSCPANFKTQNCQELRRTPSQWMWGRWDRERFPSAVHLSRATSPPWRFLGEGNSPLFPSLTEKPEGSCVPCSVLPGGGRDSGLILLADTAACVS